MLLNDWAVEKLNFLWDKYRIYTIHISIWVKKRDRSISHVFTTSVTVTNMAVCLACGHTVSLSVCPTGNSSNCNALTHGDMVSLDEGRFPALELNNRRLSVKNSFCRKNGVYTRSVGDSSF